MSSLLSSILRKTDCICINALQVYLVFSLGVEMTLPSCKITVALMSSLKYVSLDLFVLKYYSPSFFKNVKSKIISNFS